MRTTKIFFRRFRIINAFALGSLCALLLCVPVFAGIAFVNTPTAQQTATPQAQAEPARTLADEFAGYRIATYGRMGGSTFYVFTDEKGSRLTGDDLLVRDVDVKDRGPREALLVRGDDFLSLYR